MKLELWIRPWTGDHEAGKNDPDEKADVALAERVVINGIEVGRASYLSEYGPWPKLTLEGLGADFLVLHLTEVPRELFAKFPIEVMLMSSDPEKGTLDLPVSSMTVKHYSEIPADE